MESWFSFATIRRSRSNTAAEVLASEPDAGVCRIVVDKFGDEKHVTKHLTAQARKASFTMITAGEREPAVAADLLRQVVEAGLRPGIAFHVGSQQPDPAAWEIGIATAAKVAADAGVAGEVIEGSDVLGIVRDGATHRLRSRVPLDAVRTRLLSPRAKLAAVRILLDARRAGDAPDGRGCQRHRLERLCGRHPVGDGIADLLPQRAGPVGIERRERHDRAGRSKTRGILE